MPIRNINIFLIHLNLNFKISSKKRNLTLIASVKKEIQSIIVEGASITWDSYKLETYVNKIAKACSEFQEKVN
jgi:dynein heavy chain 1, cytosolic